MYKSTSLFATFASYQNFETMNGTKRIPYGISDFTDLRNKGCYYSDKTHYIPQMEAAGDFLFLIRPRRFGKSMFLSMLAVYYDIARQDKFDQLFDGLWIKEHPTEEKGKYQVMYFDFSQVNSGRNNLQDDFDQYCCIILESFARKYSHLYDESFVETVKKLAPNSAAQLKFICNEAKQIGHQLYLIIDEYDNFTNNVLNEEGEQIYHALTHATGFYREIFKVYKANFQHILMMGVSPVTLDDLTSGFNIALNITANPRFNMMLGFSENEVRQMIAYYQQAGLIQTNADDLIAEMKPWYDNYCFAEESLETDPKMFNSDMVLYYLRNYIDFGTSPKNMLDSNTRTDYKKLKRLVQLNGMSDKERGYIQQIAAEGCIVAELHSSFPAERIFDEGNFVSLLYYYGMLTIVGTHGVRLVLGIPNNNVRKQYYEYLLTEYRQSMRMNLDDLIDTYDKMAFDGKWLDAFKFIAEKYAEVASVRNGMEGERNLQGFVMSMFSLCSYYLMLPEIEMAHGYCDIFLLPDKIHFKDTAHSYILELKYLSEKDTDAKADEQWQTAIEQVRKYANDRKVQHLSQGTELHLICMQMRTTELLRIEEIDK